MCQQVLQQIFIFAHRLDRSVDGKTLDECRGQYSLFPHFLTIRPHVTAA